MMMVIVAVFIVMGKVAAAPLSNDTNTEAIISVLTGSPRLVGFVDDPNQRGTYSLVISCLLTLILCVWSALHLNVPRPDDTIWYRFWINTRWILTGVYAPELVVFTAWRQWSSARILGRKVHAKYSRSDGPKMPRHLWTLAHDFFACTGGFAFEFDKHDSSTDGIRPFPTS